jgi:hypothetical protein
MPPPRRVPLAAFVAWLAASACHDSDDDAGPAPLLANQGIGASFLQGQGELRLLGVSEFDEGRADRNGDGDLEDVVASVYDMSDGSRTDLGLSCGPAPFLAVSDALVAFGVLEAAQGHTDLNGDGDFFDLVLHVYDARTRVTTNTGLAMSPIEPVIGLGTVGFVVSESGQGDQDLDGSGAADGAVLHVYDSRTGQTRNAERAVTSALTFHQDAFGFTTDEHSAGADLNGDGDTDDLAVFEFEDLTLGGIVNVPLAIRDLPLALGDDEWVVLVDELAQGADLNGDGDTDDGVYFTVEPHPVVSFTPLGFSSQDTFESISNGEDVALVVQEIDGLDRNSDADFDDSYVAVVRPGDTILGPGLPLYPGSRFAFAGGQLVFLVSEFELGELNGDGDESDGVVHTLDLVTANLVNLGLDAFLLEGDGTHAFFRRAEDGGDLVLEDLNGDGDTDDDVFFSLEAFAGAVTNTGLAAVSRFTASSTAVLLLASESAQGADLNGDGDTEDDAWVLCNLADGSRQDLGAACSTSPESSAALLDDGRGLVLVFEGGQNLGGAAGIDLNVDGDLFDLVLHSFHVP